MLYGKASFRFPNSVLEKEIFDRNPKQFLQHSDLSAIHGSTIPRKYFQQLQPARQYRLIPLQCSPLDFPTPLKLFDFALKLDANLEALFAEFSALPIVVLSHFE